MKYSARKLTALIKKDFRDFFTNSAMLISILIPVLFVVFYKLINLPNVAAENKAQFLLNMGVMMCCSMCGIMIASTSIAEEKEKFTLRTLMLSNVSGMEFLFSKVIVGFVLTMLGNLLIFVLSGSSLKDLPFFMLASVLGSLSVNILSAVLGLLSRDQMSCGVMQVPVMLLLVLPPIFGELNSLLGSIALFTPMNAMMNIYYRGVQGNLFAGKTAFHLIVLFSWIAVSSLLFLVVYRKKGLDN